MAFSPEIVSKLEAPVNPADVEIKLDGESVNQVRVCHSNNYCTIICDHSQTGRSMNIIM